MGDERLERTEMSTAASDNVDTAEVSSDAIASAPADASAANVDAAPINPIRRAIARNEQNTTQVAPAQAATKERKAGRLDMSKFAKFQKRKETSGYESFQKAAKVNSRKYDGK